MPWVPLDKNSKLQFSSEEEKKRQEQTTPESFGVSKQKEKPESMLSPANVGEMAGSFASVAVPAALPPPYNILARMAMAGGGALLGRTAGRAIEGKEITPEESVRALAFGAGGEGLGAGIQGGLKSLYRPGKLAQGAEQAEEFLAKRGSMLTPAQATDSRAIDWLESSIEGSLFGADRLVKFKKNQQGIIEAEARRLAEIIGTDIDPEKAGQLFIDMFEGKRDAFKAAGKKLYEDVDRAMGVDVKRVPKYEIRDTGIVDQYGNPITREVQTGENLLLLGQGVDIRPLKKFAQEALTEQGTLPSSLKSVTGETFLNDMLKLKDEIPWSEAQSLRSALLTVERPAGEAQGRQAQRLATKLAGMMSKTMDESAAKLSGDALQAWKGANAFWKKGKETFNNSFIRALVNQVDIAPEKFGQILGRRRSLAGIRAVEAIVGRTGEPFRRFQAGFMTELIQKATNKQGEIRGADLLAELGPLDYPKVQLALGKNTANQLKEFAQNVALIQAKQGGGGDIVIKMMQSGALGSLFFDFGEAVRGAAGAIIISPWVLSNVLTRPGPAALLKRGLKLKPGTIEFNRWMAKIGPILIRESLDARAKLPEQQQEQVKLRLDRQLRGEAFQRLTERARKQRQKSMPLRSSADSP